MSQRTRVVLGVVVVLALAGALVWIRSSSATPAGHLAVAGDVRADVRTISAPVITYPTPDYTVGIPTGSAAGGAPSSAKRASMAASAGRGVAVAGMLTTVTVQEGDTVKAGEVVAQLDTTLLKFGVVAAKADAARSKTNVRLMNDALNTLTDAKGKLVTARAKAFSTAFGAIATGIAQAKAAQYKLHDDAVANLPLLKKNVADLKALLAKTPPTDPNFPTLKKNLGIAMGQLVGTQMFLKQWPTIKAKIDKALAKAEASAKAKAGTAINKLIGKAQSQIRKAERQVKDARAVLRIIASNSHLGVDLAQARLAQATIRTPVGGVVTFARRGGTVALVGAPLVRVLSDGPQLVDTYLAADQIAQVPIGSSADVTYDSAPGKVLHGTVTTLGSTYLYPPTGFPTSVVHMTRTLKVTISLDQSSSVPAGTPVDVSIKTTAKN